jgi:hypothetical protein
MSEEILWVAFWLAESYTLIGEEPPSEIIAINDSENSLVHIEVDANVQVLPDIVFRLVLWVWELVSFQEDSLWHSRVLNSWLDDVDGVVIKVVVDDALPDSIVFVCVLNNWFLEVTMESQHL